MKPIRIEGIAIGAKRRRLSNRIGAALVGAMLIVGVANARNEAELIPAWDAADESNDARIDHGAWQGILDGYLQTDDSGIHRVDYAALKADAGAADKLAGYLAYLQGFDPRDYSRAEQKAYWINFYNALTVSTVVEAYPVDSIRKISDSFLGGMVLSGPWGDVRAKVAGIELTLDNIEHGILRPIYRDNRVHYALNCASLGCPNLSPTVFTAANMETLLDAGAREYVNHPRGVDFVDDDFIVVSSIYDWFVEDFGGDEKGVIEHLMKYADEELAERLGGFEGAMDFEYDWNLNRP